MQILITGGTNGIGLAAAQMLAARGANVAIVGRNEARTQAAGGTHPSRAAKGVAVGTFIADLSSQAAVRKLAAEVLARYPRLDVLVNNAGAMYTTRQLTADGIELTWAVNHLAPFLLTTLLLDRLEASAPARIITTASDAHRGAPLPFEDLNAEHSYRGFGRYGQTKLANILFTLELARRLEGSGRDRQLLPSRAGGERLQPQQRPAHEPRHDGPRAGLTQLGEGRGDPGVAGDLAAGGANERGLLRRRAACDAQSGGLRTGRPRGGCGRSARDSAGRRLEDQRLLAAAAWPCRSTWS